MNEICQSRTPYCAQIRAIRTCVGFLFLNNRPPLPIALPSVRFPPGPCCNSPPFADSPDFSNSNRSRSSAVASNRDRA